MHGNAHGRQHELEHNLSHLRDLAAICRPCEGYTRAGDAWVALLRPDGERLVVVDATGHGTSAADLAERVVRLVQSHNDLAAPQLLELLSQALGRTEGAAVGVLDVDYPAQTARWTAVGNLTLRVVRDNRVERAGGSQQWDAQSGVVGLYLPKLRTSHIPLAGVVLLVVASDGIAGAALRKLQASDANTDAASLALRLVRNHGRRYDDATCLVVRLNETAAQAA